MKLKTAILATALAICSGAAFADDKTEVVTLTQNAGEWSGGFSLTHSQGAFTDSITFLPAAMGFTSAAIFNFGFSNASNIDFTSAVLFTPGTPGGTPLNLSSSGAISSGVLLPTYLTGPFRLAVTGLAGTAATYTGMLNVSAVPEVETYAMFGAGLGLVGLLARRRAKAMPARDRMPAPLFAA
jgi:hypothetical protein